MYGDSVKQWSVIVGCEFDCIYCKKSFQAQMKRQKPKFDKDGNKTRGCQDCYDYKIHFHPERLHNSLPKTKGDEFIWVCAASDLSLVKQDWIIKKILERICQLPFRQFFIQVKNPIFFSNWILPSNIWKGITLETNRDAGYEKISKAPPPTQRVENIGGEKIDIITIEPIMEFDFNEFLEMIQEINPMRVYIGYDTKKTHLQEPALEKTLELISEMEEFTTVKPKLLRERWDW